MFDKLQKRIILLNTSLIAMVVLISFTFIFTYTYSSEMSDKRQKLDSISNRPQGIINTKNKQNNPGLKKIELMSPDYDVSFSIIIGENYSVLNTFSFMDINDEIINKSLDIIKSNKKNYSTIKIDKDSWMYKTETIKNSHLSDAFPDAKDIITMIKVTDSFKNLFSLLFILFITLICIILASLFISFRFAKFSVDPIKRSFQMQKNFIDDASHELKTPLSIIKADTSIVRDGENMSETEKIKWLDKIDIEINKMTKLITSMLSLSKNEQVKVFDVSDFSVSDILQNLLTSVEVILYEKSINLKSSIEKNVIIKSSVEDVEQIISILLDNAVKYTPNNETINVILKKDSKKVIINIINSGVYFEKNDLSLLFNRFYRADKSRSRSDSNFGLGLSIAKSLTTKVKGEIYASIPSKDKICFTVILPLNI